MVARHLPALGVATGGEAGLFDVVIAVFCFNYITTEAMQRVVEQVRLGMDGRAAESTGCSALQAGLRYCVHG